VPVLRVRTGQGATAKASVAYPSCFFLVEPVRRYFTGANVARLTTIQSDLMLRAE